MKILAFIPLVTCTSFFNSFFEQGKPYFTDNIDYYIKVKTCEQEIINHVGNSSFKNDNIQSISPSLESQIRSTGDNNYMRKLESYTLEEFNLFLKLSVGVYSYKDNFESVISISNSIPDTIAIAFLPLVLPLGLDDYTISYIYHEYSKQQYNAVCDQLDRFDGQNQNIVILGGSEAGLIASYVGLRLVRHHPVISLNGNFENQNNQIKILTFNSPPPFTSEFVAQIKLVKDNFLDFITSDNGVETFKMGWARIANTSYQNDDSLVNALSIYTLSPRWRTQGLYEYNWAPQSLPRLIENEGEIVKAQYLRTISGTNINISLFINLKFQLYMFNVISGINALESHLDSMLKKRYKESEDFVLVKGLSSNWTLRQDIQCVPAKQASGNNSDNDANITVARCSFNDNVFADYLIELISEDEYRDLNHLSSSANTVFEDNPDTLGIEHCLYDLFEASPILKSFSPYHGESQAFGLMATNWPYQQLYFRLELLESRNYLLQLFSHHRFEFNSLMTSPNIENPMSCKQNIKPSHLNINEAKNGIKYWETVYKGISPSKINQGTTNSEKFSVEVYEAGEMIHDESVKGFIKEVIVSNYGSDRSYSQFDCTDPQTLWFDSSFCPKICQAIRNNSNFCKRVYINSKGIKMSLRYSNPAGKVFGAMDKSKCDWEILQSIDESIYPQTKHYYALINHKGRTYTDTYLMVIFLEDVMYPY